ncbi:MAG: hypothetical protein J6328_03375, partial [Bacilli bacterium]|nr:hypothetical protein [Bacilli bacterium]
MKERMLRRALMILPLICLLSLGGCEASWQEERNEKALCEEVFTAFFENTYRANNQIVEVSGHGVTPFTEY